MAGRNGLFAHSSFAAPEREAAVASSWPRWRQQPGPWPVRRRVAAQQLQGDDEFSCDHGPSQPARRVVGEAGVEMHIVPAINVKRILALGAFELIADVLCHGA